MDTAPPRRSREHGFVLALCLAAPVALLALGLWLHPDPRGWGTHEQLGFRPCWPMKAWNVPCPGCGVTTAVALAAHGRLVASLATQPFGAVLCASAVAAAVWASSAHRRGRDLSVEVGALPWRQMLGALLVLLLLAWLYKLALVRGWVG